MKRAHFLLAWRRATKIDSRTMPFAPLFSTGLQSMIEGAFTVGIFAYLVRATGSVAGANSVGAAFWGAMLVFDIPTGYLTHRLGPKRSLLISVALRSLAFALYFLGAHSVPVLAVASSVAGLAVAFGTGTLMGQMKLAAQRLKVRIDGQRVSSLAATFAGVGFVFGSALGWLTIQRYGLSSIWLVAMLCSLFLATLVALCWEPLSFSTDATFVNHMRQVTQHILNDKSLQRLFAADALMLTASLSVNSNFIAVFVPKLDSTPTLLLCASIGYWAIRLLASMLAGKAWARRALSGPGILFALAGTMMCAALSTGPLRVAAFAVTVGCICLCAIAFSARIYESLPVDLAATLLSVQSTLQNAAGTAGMLVLGVLLTRTTISQTWIASSLLALLVALWVWRAASLHPVRTASLTPEPSPVG